MPYPTVILKPDKEHIIESHPWIFSGAIQRVDASATDGDIVRVCDHHNHFLALASYSQVGTITLRCLSRIEVTVDASFWQSRLSSCLAKRNLLGIVTSSESGYRLCFGEADDTPGLVIDVFARTAVLVVSTLTVARQLDAIKMGLNSLNVCDSMVVRFDSSLQGFETEHSSLIKDLVWFQRDGLIYPADIAQGQKTGFFLDQSPLRTWLSALSSKPETILNLFSYTGSLGIAPAGSTSQVIHVDSSDRALQVASAAAKRQGFSRHHFEKVDIFEYLNTHASLHQMVILDPPALIKHQANKTAGSKAYFHLNSKAAALVVKNGLLVTSTCSQHMPPDQFVQLTRSCLAGREAQLLAQLTQALDHPIVASFPQSRYLTSLVWKVF